jgi:hypothetical protein
MPESAAPLAALSEVRTVRFSDAPPAAEPAARRLAARLGVEARPFQAGAGGLHVGRAAEGEGPPREPERAPWVWMRVGEAGTGEVLASAPDLLASGAQVLAGGLTDEQADGLPSGLFLYPAFAQNRSHYDYVLTQTARMARGFDPEAYLATLAAHGFSHVEVNGLAARFPFEDGEPGEFYAPFYTHCPGLNQFVESSLTEGVYPASYLAANRERLRSLAARARRHGLRPGLLCFEPRTLPESFFRRYPTLRGARVDHPFRSHRPRYTLAQDHPATREHYAELMRRLMDEVPALGYLSVWSNDSGAGFEHTSSLYVGRNGGPYMIREWRDHEAIAETAGESVVRYLRLLQEAAAETNPDFEVFLRMEHFKTEHDVILDGMGEGLSIEVPSMLVRGYDLPYRHPEYPDQEGVAGSIHHVRFEASEADRLAEARERGFEPHVTYAPGPGFNLEPLLGIPFPRLLARKLEAMRETGFRRVSALGGLLNTGQTPWWPNPRVIRSARCNPALGVDAVLERAATEWVGAGRAEALTALWDRVDAAVERLPAVPLYSDFGFVWMRLWTRPLVPDIEAIPEAERRYYERLMVSPANNPNINDLSKDVLFELLTEASGRRKARQFDDNVLPRLDRALADARAAAAASEDGRAVFADLRDRIRALRCWATTMRNTCAWVAGVHGALEADDEARAQGCRQEIREMVESEIANARDLLDLWRTASTEFMLVADGGATPFVHGERFGEHLERKIDLMQAYGDRPPAIDEGIVWRL